MRPASRNAPIAATLILAACVFALLFFASCVTGADGIKSSSVVMSFVVAGDDGHAVALARSDLNTTVVFGAGQASGELFQKPSATMPAGFPLYGPIVAEVGKVYVFDRGRDYKAKFNIGAPLPAFCAVLFRPGEAAALGLSFEPTEAPPAP